MRRAVPVLLACGIARAACLISGAVLDADSGKPLEHVRVFARPPARRSPAEPAAPAQPAILRVTDATGGFCFDSLEPGNYSLLAQRAGYLVSLFGAPPGRTEGTTQIAINGRDAIPPITIRMVAGGGISGTVLDDRGQPVEGVMVDLERKIWDLVWEPSHVFATHTGSGGVFHFPMIAPGTYYLKTEPPNLPEPGDPFYEGPLMDEKGRPMAAAGDVTFYSGSYTFAGASPVILKAGQEIDNLVIAMKPRSARRISGRIAISTDSKILLDAEVVAVPSIDIGGPGGRRHGAAIHPDGTFTVTDLRPVEHEVTVEGLPAAFSATVDLTGGDADGLILEPLHTVDIRVTAHVEGQPAPPVGPLAICNIERECGEPVEPDAKGIYGFSGLRQGPYRFRSRVAGLYVKTVAVNGRALGDAPLDLRKGVPESITIVLSANLSLLEGRLERLEPQTPGLGVSVLLVNEIRFTPEVSNTFVAADHAGHFRFDSVMPGRYHVLAIEGFDDGPWGSPELFGLLREKSIAVEIGEGENKTVAVPVIPVSGWEAALRKLGM